MGKAGSYSKLKAEVVCLYDIVVSFIPLVFYLELTFVRLGDKVFLGNRFTFSDRISEKSEDKVENVPRVSGAKAQVKGLMFPYNGLWKEKWNSNIAGRKILM